MKTHNKFTAGLCIIALATLSACGGGGGGSSGTAQYSAGSAAPTITAATSADINPGVSNTIAIQVNDADTNLSNVTVSASVVSYTGLSTAPSVQVTAPVGTIGTARNLTVMTLGDTSELGTVVVKLTATDGANVTTQNISLNVVADPYTLQTSTATTTYSGVESQLYNAVNNIARLGFGFVNQDTNLDKAALAHAQYLAANGGIQSTETSGLTSYTGATAASRASVAGYTGSSVHDVAVIVPSSISDLVLTAQIAATKLQYSVYRQQIIQNGSRDVGIGQVVANGKRYIVVSLGTKTVVQRTHSTTAFQTQPYGSSLTYSMEQDTPEAMPENNGACAGTPVSVVGRYDATLTASSFTINEGSATGSAVSTRLLTSSTDTNHLLGKNVAIAVPYSPLKLSTVYYVHFVGSITGSDGSASSIDQSWSFKTPSTDGTTNYGCSPSV